VQIIGSFTVVLRDHRYHHARLDELILRGKCGEANQSPKRLDRRDIEANAVRFDDVGVVPSAARLNLSE